MPDMLVKLYELPPCEEIPKDSFEIKTAMAANLTGIREWISSHFHTAWADEATKAILASPSSCFLAVRNDKILGFACYDATAKGFFGPTGVDPSERGKGIGRVLLLYTLHQMALDGYAYAIIGGVGPAQFYTKNCGATLIDGSTPGYYRNLL